MALNVGINGFGRIGRIIFRSCHGNPSLKVSAINDPAVDIDYICYLIKFDSTHGKFNGIIERRDDSVVVDGQKITVFREKLPTNIPWHSADVQYVVEASGMFTNLEKASGHLASDGVKRVLVTAPSLDVPMVILGVNDDQLSFGHKVISCASSTLYCLAPIINVLEENFGVSEGFITSIHAMTPSLKPLDGLCLKGKHWRDHRSIHQNIIPASTGACRALGKIIPQVKDKMTGLAFRVPIVNVSVLDITIRLKTNTTMDEIVRHIDKANKMTRNGVIRVSDEQAVSSDFVGDTHSCILDLNSSLQLTPDFFKLICWYENEYSYACRIIDSIFFLENQYQMEWNIKLAYMRPTPNPSFVQQSATHKRFGYHHACSNDSKSREKSLCSTSQDSGFKSLKRSTLAKKPISSRNFEEKQHVATRAPKKKNELFRIWNDDDDTVRAHLKHNRSSFFHSCVAITPQIEENAYVKTQERLESVKKEFSKMVSMTENLLKKSCHSKEKGLSEKLPSDAAGDTKIKLGASDEPKISLDKNDNSVSIKRNEVIQVIKENKDSSYKIKNKNRNNEEEVKEEVITKSELNVNLINTTNLLPEPLESNKNDVPTSLNTNNECENPTLDNDQIKLNVSRTSQNPTPFQYSKPLLKIAQTDKINDDIQKKFLRNTALEVKNNSSDNNTNKETVNNTNEDIGIKTPVNNCYKQMDDTFESRSDPYPLEPALSDKDEPQSRDVEQSDETNLHKSESIEPLHINGCRNLHLQKRLEGILKKLAIDSNVITEKQSICISSNNTATTTSTREVKQKQDLYDKLDSVSATDSENSFHMNERKSQVINITDLTNSLEDLERLDKICRIIEISDDLSDQLLSALNQSHDSKELRNKHWSFKDLCEKIKLDDFCKKIFSK